VTIKIRTLDQATVLDLSGSFKAGEAEQAFRSSVGELLSAGVTHIAVNLAEVSFLDSSGVGSLVHTFLTLKGRGGKLKLFAASKQVAQILRMVRLDQVLGLAEDEGAALASF
jgi:anti-anti-sigma factor